MAANLIYHLNGGAGSVPATVSLALDETSVVGATTGITLENFAPNGWNTLANGTGTHYAVGATFTMNPEAETTLFVEWVAGFDLVYDGNGSTGGTPPASSLDKAAGASVPISGNSGMLVKAGYRWDGWNTQADGQGAAIADPYVMPAANTTAYSAWTQVWTVTYDANGGTGTPPVEALSFSTGATITGKANTDLAKVGNTFNGWNTAANGSGTAVAAGGTIAMGSANIILYAQWTVNSYTVSFDKNDVAAVGTMANQTLVYNVATPLSAMTGLTKEGFTFAGWSTTSGVQAVEYIDEANYTVGAAAVTLYAQWTAVSFTVTYNGNGNTGGTVPTETNKNFGETVTTKLNTGTLVNTGHVWMGWNTAANGSGTTYGATFVMPAANTTLYALWAHQITFNMDGGSPTIAAQNVVPNVNAGKAIEPTAPTKTGLSFLGWHNEVGCTTSFDFDAVISASAVAYAKWGDPITNLSYTASNGVSFGTTYEVTAADDTANETVFSVDFNAGYALAFAVMATAANGTVITDIKVVQAVDVVTITFGTSPAEGVLIHVIAQRAKAN